MSALRYGHGAPLPSEGGPFGDPTDETNNFVFRHIGATNVESPPDIGNHEAVV